MFLTARAAVVALLGMAVTAVAPGAVTVGAIAAGIVLLAVVDALLAASPGDLAFARGPRATTAAGRSVETRLTVSNRGRRPLRGLLRDGWPPSAGAHPGHRWVELPSGGTATVRTTLTPQRRGDLRTGVLTVRSVGPLRVAGRQRTLPLPGEVRVLPRTAGLRALPALLTRLRDIDGRLLRSVRGPGTEFDTLRSYVPGDDVRAIDWRGTARRQETVVRTWRPERNRRVVLAIDTGRSAARLVGAFPGLDAIFDAALLLTALAVRAGDRVDLLAADVRTRAEVGRATVASAAAALYRVEPVLVDADPGALAAAVLRRAPRHALVVLFTGIEPDATGGSLLPAVQTLASRHTVIVASPTDPALVRLAAGREDVAAVYAAAAAARELVDRASATARLRRCGADVVDAPPEAFGRAVADRYLDVKAAGRL